jgi:hypothetical protein
MANAARRAMLNVLERQRLVRQLTEIREYLADYEMQDLVEEALQLATKLRKHVRAKEQA